jgi:ribosomal protein S8
MMTKITPQEMIAWLENAIKRRDRNLHTDTSSKMERAILAYIKEKRND